VTIVVIGVAIRVALETIGVRQNVEEDRIF
jgi:hypothetical protein